MQREPSLKLPLANWLHLEHPLLRDLKKLRTNRKTRPNLKISHRNPFRSGS